MFATYYRSNITDPSRYVVFDSTDPSRVEQYDLYRKALDATSMALDALDVVHGARRASPGFFVLRSVDNTVSAAAAACTCNSWPYGPAFP